MKTQQERILELLQERGELGVHSWEMTNDMNIMQYGARVLELRGLGHNIVNVKKNHFVLRESKNQKLKALRKEYRQAKEKQEYGKMDLIETRARVIKMQSNNFIDVVEQALI